MCVLGGVSGRGKGGNVIVGGKKRVGGLGLNNLTVLVREAFVAGASAGLPCGKAFFG